MAIITPHTLNIILKRAKNMLVFEDYDEIVKTFDGLSERPFDIDYFDKHNEEYIKDQIDLIVVCALLECNSAVKEHIGNIRNRINPIFIQNLLLANRLFKEHSDIGTLDELPELVKFEIHKMIYNYL